MRKAIIILWVGILMIAGCVPATHPSIVFETQTPSRIPKPSKTSFPTKTPTVVPLSTATLFPYSTSTPSHPLLEHKWYPEKVLISVDFTGGDGCCFFPQTPHLMLFADGTLIMTRYDEIDNIAGRRIWEKKLNRQEICQHLNSLDQVGFLDYDPSTYVFDGDPRIMGGGNLLIDVNAWKSNGGAFRDLNSYFMMYFQGDSGPGTPTILPALLDTYFLIVNYPEVGFELYSTQELGVWIMEATEFPEGVPYIHGSELGPWPIEHITLAKLFSENSSFSGDVQMHFLKFSGDEAINLYNFVGRSFNDGDTIYEIKNDGSKKYYYLFARPLLPYEQPNNNGIDFYAKNLGKEDFELSCYPSDGVLSRPSPTLP